MNENTAPLQENSANDYWSILTRNAFTQTANAHLFTMQDEVARTNALVRFETPLLKLSLANKFMYTAEFSPQETFFLLHDIGDAELAKLQQKSSPIGKSTLPVIVNMWSYPDVLEHISKGRYQEAVHVFRDHYVKEVGLSDSLLDKLKYGRWALGITSAGISGYQIATSNNKFEEAIHQSALFTGSFTAAIEAGTLALGPCSTLAAWAPVCVAGASCVGGMLGTELSEHLYQAAKAGKFSNFLSSTAYAAESSPTFKTINEPKQTDQKQSRPSQLMENQKDSKASIENEITEELLIKKNFLPFIHGMKQGFVNSFEQYIDDANHPANQYSARISFMKDLYTIWTASETEPRYIESMNRLALIVKDYYEKYQNLQSDDVYTRAAVSSEIIADFLLPEVRYVSNKIKAHVEVMTKNREDFISSLDSSNKINNVPSENYLKTLNQQVKKTTHSSIYGKLEDALSPNFKAPGVHHNFNPNQFHEYFASATQKGTPLEDNVKPKESTASLFTLKTNDWKAFIEQFDTNTKETIRDQGTPEQRETIPLIELLQTHQQKYPDGFHFEVLKEIKKNSELKAMSKSWQETGFVFDQLGSALGKMGNPDLGRVFIGVGGAITFASGVVELASGFSMGGVGLLFTGANILLSAASDNDEDGMSQYLEAIYASIQQVIQMLSQLMEYLQKTHKAMYEFWFIHFRLLHLALDRISSDIHQLIAQENFHYLQNKASTDHIIDSQHKAVLLYSRSHGKLRAHPMKSLSQEKFKDNLSKLLGLMSEAYQRYLSGESLYYNVKVTGATSAASAEIQTLLQSGKIYKFLALSFAEEHLGEDVSALMFEPGLMLGAFEEYLRWKMEIINWVKQEALFKYDENNIEFSEVLEKLQAFLKAYKKLQPHAPTYFARSHVKELDVIDQINRLYDYPDEMVGIVNGSYLTTQDDVFHTLLKPAEFSGPWSEARHTVRGIYNSRLKHNKNPDYMPSYIRHLTVLHEGRNIYSIKEYSALYAFHYAKLGSINALTWTQKKGSTRTFSGDHTCTLNPYPLMNSIHNGTAFSVIEETGHTWFHEYDWRRQGNVNVWRPDGRQEVCDTGISASGNQILVNHLNNFFNAEIQKKQDIIRNNFQSWSDILTYESLKRRQACVAFGLKITDCYAIPKFIMDSSAIRGAFDDEQSKIRHYEDALPKPASALMQPGHSVALVYVPDETIAAYLNNGTLFNETSKVLKGLSGCVGFVEGNASFAFTDMQIYYVNQWNQSVALISEENAPSLEIYMTLWRRIGRLSLRKDHLLIEKISSSYWLKPIIAAANYPAVSSLFDYKLLLESTNKVIQEVFLNQLSNDSYFFNPMIARMEMMLAQGNRFLTRLKTSNLTYVQVEPPFISEVRQLREDNLLLRNQVEENQKILMQMQQQLQQFFKLFTLPGAEAYSMPDHHALILKTAPQRSEWYTCGIWSNRLLGDYLHCDMPEKKKVRIIQQLSAMETPLEEIVTHKYERCYALWDGAEEQYCVGEKSHFIEMRQDYGLASLGQTALLSGLTSAVPEAIGDLCYLYHYVSEKQANDIKLLINLSLLLMIGNIMDDVTSIFVAYFISSVLKKSGWFSEQQARTAGNVAASMVITSKNATIPERIMTTSVGLLSARIGLWAEKRVVKYLAEKNEFEPSFSS